MFFEQIIRQDIGCAAYVVGSTGAGEAAVIDPRIDMVPEIIDLAEREGMRIRYVVETHNHADHVSGHHLLAQRTGATIAVYEAAGAAYPHLPLRDGQELTLGEVRLRAIHTPGHRPEHIAVGVIDSTRGDEPWVVLTGDSLFIGDVARPDLAVDGQEGAEALFHSLHKRLLTLPDGTLAYPTHVSGSLCGRVTNRMTGTSIGFERHFNPALTISEEKAFVQFMNESLPERPPNMARIVELNKVAEPLEIATPGPLTAEQVKQAQAEGAAVLDIRSPAGFAAGHVPGAITVDFNGNQFQNRVGLVLSAAQPLVIIANSDEQIAQIGPALAVIGFNRLAGYLNGGMSAWKQAGYEVATLPQMSVQQLAERRAQQPNLQVIDVRERSEWEGDHIEGAALVPFHKLSTSAGALDLQKPVALVCASGHRSMIAASILRAQGAAEVINVEGGMNDWHAANLPTESAQAMAGAAK